MPPKRGGVPGFPFDMPRLIRDNADENPADPRRAADHFLCKIGLEFVYARHVEERVENRVHVVRLLE